MDSLILAHNKLTKVPANVFSHLTMLNSLELEGNNIAYIDEDAFSGLEGSYLYRVPCAIECSVHCTSGCHWLRGGRYRIIWILLCLSENLQYLRLGDNNLHIIPSDALRPLHRLRHLDLRSNNITVVAEDALFGYGDTITFLNLQKNE